MPIQIKDTDSLADPGFRGDLRPPMITFGRCGITGEFAKCIQVDLGDMLVQAPGYRKADGSWVDPETITYRNAVTLSEAGLNALKDALANGENPIPTYTPTLKYQWEVRYTDGSAQRQFEYDLSSTEVENKFPIGAPHMTQVSLIDRLGLPNGLPTYTFDVQSGDFYRNGERLETHYAGELHNDRSILCVRKNSVLFGSQVTDEIHRDIGLVHASVTYVLGWKHGGWGDACGSCNLIAIDERGRWRPYEQISPEREVELRAQTLRVSEV